ncbi:AI-2E family transporter [Halobacteria archaeon AArc-m2/3/4]|uniref:AI-2E family transporter n=1 Tax=Natronoglomus mannanivorans TaxID=2979990 RepID=A0ABT2QM25_9EURY|nr:AI-2E family transporter [Halobacteria archaeon AArc-m2/3/4]
MRWCVSSNGEGLPRTIGWWLFALVLVLVLVVALHTYLGWIVLGLFLYYVLRPVARRLQRQGVSPGLSAFLSIGLTMLPFITVLGVFTILLLAELAAIEATDVEGLLQILFPGVAIDTLPTSGDELYAFVDVLRSDPTLATLAPLVSGFVGTFTAQAFNALITIIFTFFLVRDERRIASWFRSTIVERESNAYEYLKAVDQGLSSVYFGYTLTIIVISIVAVIIYNVLNLVAPPGLAIPHAILLGSVTGLISVIPLFGRSLLYGVIVLYLAIGAYQTNLAYLWFPIVFYVVMGIIFDNVIRTYVRPFLSGRLFHTGLVMFAYLLGPAIFGWYGIFLGPFIMVVTIQFLRVQLPKIHSV